LYSSKQPFLQSQLPSQNCSGSKHKPQRLVLGERHAAPGVVVCGITVVPIQQTIQLIKNIQKAD